MMERRSREVGDSSPMNAAPANIPAEFPPVQSAVPTDAPGKQKLQFNITVNDNHVVSPFDGLQERMMATLNQAWDKQMVDAAGAVIPGLVNGLGATAKGLMFMGGVLADAVSVARDDLQIGYEKLTYPALAEANADRLSERLHRLLETYRPVLESVQQAYAPVAVDLQDIGARGEANPMAYARLIADPIKSAAAACDSFSGKSAANQVTALMNWDAQMVAGGALARFGESAAGAVPKAACSGLDEVKVKMAQFKEEHAAIMERFKDSELNPVCKVTVPGQHTRECNGLFYSRSDDQLPQPDKSGKFHEASIRPDKLEQITTVPINGATRSVPLGFKDDAQFLQAARELQDALKSSGINDATVGVRGSSVTGFSCSGVTS